jgi:hypothetical protein
MDSCPFDALGFLFPFPMSLVHSVWIIHLGLKAKVKEQTMPAQAITHLEGKERATQQGPERLSSASFAHSLPMLQLVQ